MHKAENQSDAWHLATENDLLSKSDSQIFLFRGANPQPRGYSALKERYGNSKNNPMEQIKVKFASSFYFGDFWT